MDLADPRGEKRVSNGGRTLSGHGPVWWKSPAGERVFSLQFGV